MLNYISAEWYKLRHTKGIFIAFVILLAFILILFLPKFWVVEMRFEIYAVAYLAFLPLGFFLAPIFASKAFDDQYGRGTLKNEVVFGIPRSHIYLGKLAFGALVGTGGALIVVGFYLLMNFLAHGMGEENILPYVDLCVQGTLLTLPLWLASLSLAFCLQVIVKNSAGAIVLDYLILIFGTPLALVGTDEPTASAVMNFFTRWFFVAPFRVIYTAMDQEQVTISGLRYSWMVALGWIVVTTLAGIAAFSRKEIS